MQILITARGDINARDSFGLTVLGEAIRCGNDSIVKRLRDAGAKEANLDALRLASASEHWAVPSVEVKLGKCLGTTMKSAVYVASWRGTRVVAKMVKQVNLHALHSAPEDSTASCDAHALDEMLHEIRTLSTLRHPDLVLFLGACLDTTPCFFLTEYMEGGDLEHYCAAQQQKLGHPFKPPQETVLRWGGAVARALAFMHNCSQPIIHRDLKPLNLLLTKNLDMKVTDFGLSKIMTYRNAAVPQQPAPYMSGGVGTWRYMAPEVVRYEQYTDRIDIYAFGLILWFMCSGRQPFVELCGGNPELVLKAYLRGEEPRPPLHSSVGSATLRELMKDAWHVSPAKRPSGCECAQRIAEMSGGSGSCALH